MARKTSVPATTVVPQPEPTREERLAKANEQALFHFGQLKNGANQKLHELRERLVDPDHLLSNEIGWVAEDILMAEVRLEACRWFEGMLSETANIKRTPFEAACYIYRDVTSRLVDLSSYGGMDIHSSSTNPASNAMAHFRAKAMSHLIRYDLSFVKFNAKKLGVDLFFDAE